MDKINSSSVSINAFKSLVEGDGDKRITSKDGELKSTPAKMGFFGRVVNFIQSVFSGKVNAEARASFQQAMKTAYPIHADRIMFKHGFDGQSSKPLMGREIQQILNTAKEVKEKGKEILAMKDAIKFGGHAQERIENFEKESGSVEEKRVLMEKLEAVVERGGEAERNIENAKNEIQILVGNSKA